MPFKIKCKNATYRQPKYESIFVFEIQKDFQNLGYNSPLTYSKPSKHNPASDHQPPLQVSTMAANRATVHIR